jgi:hypothetical protein
MDAMAEPLVIEVEPPAKRKRGRPKKETKPEAPEPKIGA